MPTKPESKLLDGKVTLRAGHAGSFDELLTERADVHMEMMDDRTLWIGLSWPDRTIEVHVTIQARGKLKITAVEA